MDYMDFEKQACSSHKKSSTFVLPINLNFNNIDFGSLTRQQLIPTRLTQIFLRIIGHGWNG